MKKSTSNNIISTAVIKSNLKRYMPIIFLGIGYFFFLYVFPGFFTDNITSYLKDKLTYTMMGIRFYCAGMPLIISVALFNFLHKKNAVLFHHSIPVKRSQMYVSLLIAGIVLINVPILVFGVYVSAMLNMSIAIKVIAFGFISSTFVFAICSLAGVITGTTLMHFIVACWFNFLPQSIYYVLTSFGEGLLNGYSNDTWQWVTIMSPETHHFAIASYQSVVYLLVALVIYAVAGLLYKKVKLEKAENAVVFTSIKVILNVIVSVYFMALLGLIVYGFNQTTTSFIIGSAIGAIVGTYLGYMIFNKTFKIFNVRTFKLAAVLFVVSMLLSLAFVYDIAGYETKVPKTNEVKSVKVESSLLDRTWNFGYEEERQAFKSKDNITNVLNIHNRCVSTEKLDELDPNLGYLNISYNLKNGNSLSREYYVSEKDPIINKNMKAIFASKEFKKDLLFELILPSISRVEVHDISTGKIYTVDGKKKVDLLEAMDKDIMEMKYEDSFENDNVYRLYVYDKNNEQIRDINIFTSDKNVIKYINNKLK